jgi:hypothetical protein
MDIFFPGGSLREHFAVALSLSFTAVCLKLMRWPDLPDLDAPSLRRISHMFNSFSGGSLRERVYFLI